MVREMSNSKKLFIGGDLNDDVGPTRRGYERVYDDFGYSKQNQEGGI
jgi:hypothetical protein